MTLLSFVFSHHDFFIKSLQALDIGMALSELLKTRFHKDLSYIYANIVLNLLES
jgi:hypothetical protein